MWALSGFTAVFFAITWPLLPRFTHATYGGPGDGWALIWQTWQRFAVGPTYFSTARYDDIAWPFGTVQATSLLLSNIVSELPNMALLGLGFGNVTAYNVMILIAGVGSSLAMYAVLRRLGLGAPIAFWAGLVYLMAPWQLDRLAIHLPLAILVWLPVLMLGVVEWIRRPSLRSGSLVAGATALATYTHGYYGLAAGLILLGSFPLALLVAGREHRLTTMGRRTAVLAPILALTAVPLAIALVVQRDVVTDRLDRPSYLGDYAASAHLYLLPSADNGIVGGPVRHYLDSRELPRNTGELALYLGAVTLLLAIVGVVSAIRGRSPRLPVAVAGIVALVGVAFSLPGTVDLPVLGATSMPVAYLQGVFGFISTPARFFVLTLSGLIVIAAFGLQALVKRMPAGWRWTPVVLAVVLSMVELPSWGADRVVEADTPPPAVQAIIDEVPRGEPVAQYPSAQQQFRPVADQLYWQTVHGHPLMNGGPPDTLEDDVRATTEDPARLQTPALLALLGIRWATYEPDSYRFLFSAPALEGRSVPPGFDVRERLSDGSLLLRVRARPASGMAIRDEGFSIEGAEHGELWLERDRGSLLVCATAPGTHVLRFTAIAFAQPRRLRVGSARTGNISPAGPAGAVSVRVHLRRGWQTIPVVLVGSAPQRPSDLIPGSEDARTLSVSVGPVDVFGPRGNPKLCRMRPPGLSPVSPPR